jgi:uncharacterized protein involved in exopolysaccharide biosynthesis
MEMEQQNQQKTTFSDYLYVLYKWKKFIIINLLFLIIIGTVYSFLIPETFKSTSLIMFSQSNTAGLGLGGMIGSNNTASLGAQLLGFGESTEDIIFGILNSRTVLVNVINKFNLIEYYEIDDENYDKALKAFVPDLVFDPTENGLIEVSVINKDPVKASKIANYFVEITDSMNIHINLEQAKNNRGFIEKRYKKNISDLKAAEDSLLRFQKKTGIFAAPEQLEIAVKASAEIEAELFQKKLAVDFIKSQYGVESPQYKNAVEQVKFIEEKVNELNQSKKIAESSNILYSFKEMPQLAMDYYRFFREVELQSKILEFVLPLYEQALVEEQKSIPTIVVVDKAVPPQLKYAPKKAFVILLFAFFGLFILLPVVFWAERSVTVKDYKNELEEKQKKLFEKVARIYMIKYISK